MDKYKRQSRQGLLSVPWGPSPGVLRATQGGSCSVPLKDTVPWKGAGVTQHTWLFVATEVTSWFLFYREVRSCVTSSLRRARAS